MRKILINHISRIVCACTKGRLALTLALALVALFATVGVLAKDYSSLPGSNAASGAKNSVLSLSSLPSRIKKRLFQQKSSQAKASLSTAKKGYVPGETVTFRGEGFRPGEIVSLRVTHLDGTAETSETHNSQNVTVGEDGTFTASINMTADGFGHDFVVTAHGESSTASTTYSQVAFIAVIKSSSKDGETAELSGSYFASKEPVTLQVTDSVGSKLREPMVAYADEAGQITASWRIGPDESATEPLLVTAQGQMSGLKAEAATPQPLAGTNGGCIEEVAGIGKANCTANDVSLTDIVPGSVIILDADGGCTSTSDTVTFTAQGVFTLTTNERFDIGVYIATDGDGSASGDAGDVGDGARGGQCTRFALANAPDPPYVNLDADVCGDINGPHSPLTQAAGSPLGPVTIQCVDNDGDGKVDLIHCETWNQPGANTVCNGSADVKAGSPAKCNCGTLPSFCIAVPDNNACTRDVCAGTCSGSGAVCENNGQCPTGQTCDNITPQHIPVAVGTACGDPSSGACDAPDTCNANGVCSSNTSPSTTTCRVSAGQCDVAESCDGVSKDCPADGFAAATTTCVGTSTGGPCDGTDSCSGTANTCVDGFQSATTTCRASAGQCDVAESCTGSSGACPANGFQPATTACTGTSNGGPCDGTDSCDGAGACVDGFKSSTTTCRESAGQCDVAESCTGSSGACPANGFQPATTACTGTSNGGACDGTDSCDGAGACVDGFQPATTICRPSAGGCDIPESCTGSSSVCPVDVNPACVIDTQIAPTATTCLDYTSGTAADLNELLYGLKGGVINNISPGVLFLYDTIHLASTGTIFVDQTDGSWTQFLSVHSGQVILYSLSCSKLNVGTTSISASGDVTITGVPAGDYVLGIKYDPNALKGYAPPTPIATFTFTVTAGGAPSGSDSIDVKPKP